MSKFFVISTRNTRGKLLEQFIVKPSEFSTDSINIEDLETGSAVTIDVVDLQDEIFQNLKEYEG